MTIDSGRASRVKGSFRDPSGYVFLHEERIFRAVSLDAARRYGELQAEEFFGRWMDEGRIVRTRAVTNPELLTIFRREHPGYEQFLEHDRIVPITHPYEWPVSMLAAAAVHTLDLQRDLLRIGWALKDASAYNVQFVKGRPTFIDVPSIERPSRADVWNALGQFHQMFTYPLLLAVYRGWDTRSYFLASPQGRSVEKVARCLGSLRLLDPRFWLDLSLPYWFSDKDSGDGDCRTNVIASSADGPASSSRAENRKSDSRAQLFNLDRLRRKLARLTQGYRPSGVWADYTQACSYEKAAEESKKRLIRNFLEQHRPATVLDLGSNSGDYSLLAASTGARVIAVDNDHDAVELLYRRLQKEPADVSPVIGDLTNPSPGVGFRNEERASFLERAPADCVLALALLHHLLVTGNLPLAMIRDQLADLTRNLLILEFVPPHDPMFVRLTRLRTEKFTALTLRQVEDEFAERFQILDVQALPESPRTLLFLRVRR